MRRTVPPSAEIEEQIDRLLSVGVGESPRESLSALAKLGARLIIQRAVEDEFEAWLGRARYERRPEYQRGLRNYESGLRNGFRPRRVQTLEGELEVEIPQVREAAEPFVSKLFPCSTKVLRTEPLKAMVIGRFPGETSCLTLVWAVLDLYITHAKNGVGFNQLERQRLHRMRYQGSGPTTHEDASAA